MAAPGDAARGQVWGPQASCSGVQGPGSPCFLPQTLGAGLTACTHGAAQLPERRAVLVHRDQTDARQTSVLSGY